MRQGILTIYIYVYFVKRNISCTYNKGQFKLSIAYEIFQELSKYLHYLAHLYEENTPLSMN